MEYESICVEPSITGLQVSMAGSSHVGRIFPTTPDFYSELYWKIIVISHSFYNIRSACWGEVQTVISLFSLHYHLGHVILLLCSSPLQFTWS